MYLVNAETRMFTWKQQAFQTNMHNTCTHADFFYESLEEQGILEEIVKCASDKDASTRKFACFAIGNAAFHR